MDLIVCGPGVGNATDAVGVGCVGGIEEGGVAGVAGWVGDWLDNRAAWVARGLSWDEVFD